MVRSNRIMPADQLWGTIPAIISLCQIAIVVLTLIAFASSPVYGQMGNISKYSDAWGDDNYLYGCGITEDQYNSYNHTFKAITTMTSPNGRVATQDSGFRAPSARADVLLTFDENDLGNNLISTQHYTYCPVVRQTASLGSTGASVRSGISSTCYTYYRHDPNDGCWYLPINGCTSRCILGLVTYPLIPDGQGLCYQHIRVKQRWTETDCGCPSVQCFFREKTPFYPCNTCVDLGTP
jgi:hypothetical protein